MRGSTPMPEPAKKDPKAPKFLEIIINDNDGKIWPSIYVHNKKKFTDSVSYYSSEKINQPGKRGSLSRRPLLYPHGIKAGRWV
jgi:hypothetical protein